jgi:malate dehydrogenase (oxaloacetate-decarboxylating)(NADP+)
MDEQLNKAPSISTSFPFPENSGSPYQASGHPARSGAGLLAGVAAPCLEIEKDPLAAYKYTARGNLVAVVSNGTAVLGLGNIGAGR